MKIKTIDLSHEAYPTKRRKRCNLTYREWININGNKVVTVVFCLLTLGFFFGVIFLSIHRADTSQGRSRLNGDDDCDCSAQKGNQKYMANILHKYEIPNEKEVSDEEEFIDNPEILQPDQGPDQLCTIQDCFVKCKNVEEANLSKEILDLPLEINECNFIELELKECSFLHDYLKPNFLSDLNKKITRLEIKKSNLTHILPDTFDSVTFKTTLISLTIDNDLEIENHPLKFQMMSKGSFKGLSSLNYLAIVNCPSLAVLDTAALDNLKGSLSQLKISRIPNMFEPSSVLSSSTLSKITVVDFQRMNIPSINNLSFTSIAANVKSLNLANSKIESIEASTFDKFWVLESLFLELNLLMTLPQGVFDKILNIPYIVISLKSNRWECDCLLTSLQRLILDNPTTFPESAACYAPLEMQDIPIANAELCSEETSGSTYRIRSTTSQPSISDPESFECDENEGCDIEPPTSIDPPVIEPDEMCIITYGCAVRCRKINEENLSKEILDLPLQDNHCTSIELELEECFFVNDYLKPNFLSNLNMAVTKLEIKRSYLTHILPDTFDSDTFRGALTSLTINNELEIENHPLTFQMLAKGSFKGLSSLSYLAITDCPSLAILDTTALDNLKNSLMQLKISRIPNIWQPSSVLSSSTLSQITVVDFQKMNIPSIDSSSFTSIASNVKSLNLAYSKIESIDTKTFEKFKALENLYLQLNLLTTLPPKVFDKILTKPSLTITLSSNQWNCDCDLLHLQKLILFNPTTFAESASCVLPPELQGREIAIVELCPEESSKTTFMISSSLFQTSVSDEPECDDDNENCNSEGPTSTDPPETSENNEVSTTYTDSSTKTLTEATETTQVTEATPTIPTTTEPLLDSTMMPPEHQTWPPTGNEETYPPNSSPHYEPTPDYQMIDIKCYRANTQSRTVNSSIRNSHRKLAEAQLFDFTLNLPKPIVSFDFESADSDSIVQLVFHGYFTNLILVYYPGSLDTSDLSDENVECQIVTTEKVIIKDLQLTTVYLFCVFINYDPYVQFQTPFQCKSFQTPTPYAQQPWIYQEQKVIFLTSFLMFLLLSLVLGIIMTYFLIRRIPTLMKGSKRVVMVNNRTKDVMVLSGGSRNNSLQKEAATPIKTEAPIYLTPLPRQSFDYGNGSTLIRCSSDTSLKSARSYISVSRCPPRFSQVFQSSDFKSELPRRCGSYPHCHSSATAPCHSPDPIPPPLPRRSIASTATSWSFEGRKPNNASIYQRQPSRIEDETEDHYNFII